jgi:hypothetical protein
MSRQQKIHPPIKGNFNNILAAVAAGSGTGKPVASRPTSKPVIVVKVVPKKS